MRYQHPALRELFAVPATEPFTDRERGVMGVEHTTSLALARALAVGCLARLDVDQTSIDVWDPTVGSGFASHLLVSALRSSGAHVRFRGQDINEATVSSSRQRFDGIADVQLAVGNTLEADAFEGYSADLIIVDPPWGLTWEHEEPSVMARHGDGAFAFGLPQRTDSTWLFISLALEKLRSTGDGGGRVAALVHRSALSAGGATDDVRRHIVQAGLLESVTRLPEGLAPATSIPLYLLTFANQKPRESARGKAMIADLQTSFTTEFGRRSIPESALLELESGLRSGKPGPRNRSIELKQFTRREAQLWRPSSSGAQLSWRLTTYNDTVVDSRFLEARYGPDSGVSVAGPPQETLDLDPSRLFQDDTQELLRNLAAKTWPSRRLSCLLATAPEATSRTDGVPVEGQILVPTYREGKVSVGNADGAAGGRVLAIRVDEELVEPTFLAAWLNSEQGAASRRRALAASSSGTFVTAVRSDSRSLMRWADELIVPVPERSTQVALASADERLSSFQSDLSSEREAIWATPEDAEGVVSKFARAFDDSIAAWSEQLPFPVASALWTAETVKSSGEKLQAYFHAWEALVTFHATVLLSAVRSDPGSGVETESVIRQTLVENGMSIGRATFGTWTVMAEAASANLRRTLERGDADDVARVRASFADLSATAIERLISRGVVKKFQEANHKRNRWLGHGGHTSEDQRKAQLDSLVSDLRELRPLLGNVWAQLLLVRAGSARRERHGFLQSAEVAIGTRSPFASRVFQVGDAMLDGELYLVRDGSKVPLRLAQFVQLRAAPSNAQYTSYFYNRTEGSSVRLVSYQYGPESEVGDDAERFRDDFGALVPE